MPARLQVTLVLANCSSCTQNCLCSQQQFRGLQALLTELARIRRYGFSPREVEIAQAKLMADIESAYLERDQSYSTDVREEYVRHFLHGALSPRLDPGFQTQNGIFRLHRPSCTQHAEHVLMPSLHPDFGSDLTRLCTLLS